MRRLISTVCLSAFLVAAASGLAAEEPNGPAISFRLKKDSKVSIAIYDQQGEIVRQLLLAEPRKAGRNTAVWDGLDEQGKPAAPGRHPWKLLSSQGLKAEWMVSLGTNLNPGWQIMPGNHVGAVTAARDDTGVYVMGGCSECVPGMEKVTPDGRSLWTSDHLLESNNDCGVGLAGGRMYSLLGNAKLIAVDPATGKGQWKVNTEWNDMKETWKPGRGVLCMAARGDQIVISNKDRNVIQWLKPEDGSKIDEAAVTAPRAVAIDGAGNVLAISGDTVVKLSRADKAAKPIITGLASAMRLDADPKSGEIFVAQTGSVNQVNVNQIKRFSADGKLLNTYGRAGGRLFGKYEPQDFLGITDIKADGAGGFVVVEGAAAPRRVAFFDKAGKLVREWYGGVHYANGGAVDPDDVSIAWYHSGSGQVVKAKIDFVKKTYQVLETYQLIGIGDGIIGSGNSMDTFVVRHFKGRTYLVNMNISPRIVMVDEANRRLVPVVSGKYFLLHDFLNANYTPRAFLKAYFGGTIPDNPKYGSVDDAKNKEAVIWTDLNGDGLPQDDEMVFSPRKLMIWSCGRIWADEQMNLYEMNDRPMVWRPKGWTKDGAPIYGGWADWQPMGDKPSRFDPLQVTWPAGSGVIPLPEGGFLGFFNNTQNPFGKGIGSEGIGGNYIVKWNKDGKVVWTTGRHAPDFGAAPGEGRFLWNVAGLAHGCFAVTDMQCYFIHKNLVHVWDPDGLWVGRLLENPDLNAAPVAAYHLATENFGGTLVEVTRKNKAPGLSTGDVIFAGCGQNVTAIYRITGWDTFARDKGTLTLTPEQAELAKTTAFRVAAARMSIGKLSRMKKHVAATLPRLAAPPVLDGKLDDEAWKKAGAVDDFRLTPAEEDNEEAATTVFVGYDDTNFYFAFRCKEPNLDKLRAFGSPMHLDDSIEIFIDAGCTRSKYYQFIINPNGQFYVGKGWAAQPDAKISTKAGREADAWVVEGAAPWALVEGTPPAEGDRVGFNVVRNRFAGVSQSSNWSPLRGNLNHTPGYFGTLYAGDKLPRGAVALIAGDAFIRNLKDVPVNLDGSLAEWKGVAPLKIYDGAKLAADVYLGWKPDGLYAAFDVNTVMPWRNGSAFDMAFNGGAAVDLNVGPLEPERKKGGAGDVRFIAAPLDGKTEVVEFLVKLAEGTSGIERAPRTYHTDAQGDNVLDRVARLEPGSAAAQVKPDGKGYIVEMHVPLRPPLKLESGQRFRFDATVILSDPAGARAMLRLPWFSTNGDDMFVATDVVIESTLRPANWGVAELE
ncbi:MAG TPA: sugar-binding protein [Planctomycetota bacterium]|nr:sugar-binding protein [Planctomycetota bacterium]